MFEFDENLFNDAYFENLRLLQSFNSIERAINDIYSIDGDYDGRGTIENILVDLKFIMKNVDNLDKQMIKVKKI